jgi:hypothetical protein
VALLQLCDLVVAHLPDTSNGEGGTAGWGGWGGVRLRADRERYCEAVPLAAVAIIALVLLIALTDTVNTLVTVSHPAGSHHLAADRKLGKVPTRRKQSVFSS